MVSTVSIDLDVDLHKVVDAVVQGTDAVDDVLGPEGVGTDPEGEFGPPGEVHGSTDRRFNVYVHLVV